MSVQKFLTDEKLVEYFDQKVSDLLLSHGLYDIGNYGWQSEDTADPDYIGHAMWQTSPPVEAEWEYLFDSGLVRHRPTEKEKLLTVAGSDFEGLMRASRLSIGLCLFHKSIAIQNPLEDNHYFWLHYTDAMLHLDMAADRIREYFVVAFFDETSKEHKKRGRKYGWFVTPFNTARDHCSGNKVQASISNALAPLANMADQIYKFREDRNKIVHDISTRLGKMYRDSVESQQYAFDSKLQAEKEVLGYDVISKRQEEIKQGHQDELSRYSIAIIEWYKLLVKFSSHVFEAEHRLRLDKVHA